MKNFLPLLTVVFLLLADVAWVQRRELNRGRELERQDQLEEALQLYSALYSKYPNNLRVFHALKRVYFKLQRYDEFISLIEEAYEKNPIPEYSFSLGEANLRRGRRKNANQWFTRFLDQSYTEVSFHKVASVYTSMGMLQEAAKIYEEGRKRLKNDILFGKEIALLYKNIDPERYLRESLRLYRATQEERVWVERMLKEEVKEGNQTMVLRVLTEEINSHRDNRELHTLLGDIFVELNDYERALKEYKLSEETRALLWLAKECEEEGKFNLAIKAYEDYIKENPKSTEAYIGMGNCFSAIGNFDEAEKFYEKATGEDAIKALYKLGEIKLLRGDFPGARNYYREIEKRFPFASTEALFRIVDTYMREGKFEEAEKECKKALSFDSTRAYYLLGEINYYKGDFPKAKEYYEKVVANNPNSMWINDSMERLMLLSFPEENLRTYALAEALLLQQKYDASIAALKELLKESPSTEISPYALFLIARAYEEKGEPNVAIGGFRDVIDSYPDSYLCPYAQYRIGLLYLNKIKDVEKAKEELEAVLFKYPESVIAEKVRNELRNLE